MVIHVTPATFKIEKTSHKAHDGYGHPKYVTHARQVEVEPAKKSVEKTEPVYKTEKFNVLVKPATATKIWHPPIFEKKVEKVVVKPAYEQKVWHPPVIDYVEEKVIVRHGHTFSRPVYKKHGEAC